MSIPTKTETAAPVSSSQRPLGSPNMATTPTTLHKFTLLPPELRNLIWEASLPEPRVFDIYPASTSQRTPAEQGLRFTNRRSEAPPALAAVCRESRSLALHHYRPLTLDGTTKYVDLARDVLLLESCLYERNLLRALLFMGRIPLVRDRLRSLALGTSYGVHTGVWHPVLGWKKLTRSNMGRLLQRLGAFPALERLVFVVHQEMQFGVASLPSPPREVGSTTGSPAPAPGGRCALKGGGDLMGNAVVYQVGTGPPPPRALAGTGEAASSIPSKKSRMGPTRRHSGPLDPAFHLVDGEGKGHFYRVPWTTEKPWLPHTNEISYYPPPDIDTVKEEDDETTTTTTNPETPKSKTSQHVRGLVPTRSDWECFRRMFKRDLETGLRLGLAEKGPQVDTCKKRKRALAEREDEEEQEQQADAEVDVMQQRPRSKRARKAATLAGGRGLPAIVGASLVWRYSLPS